jgi:Icc-related predicted phosphoesterase
MIPCLFASDLHGSVARYLALFAAIERERPAAVFLGGDLLPGGLGLGDGPSVPDEGFVAGFLVPRFLDLGARLGADRPRVLLIPGNDDPASSEPAFLAGEASGAFEVLHLRRTELHGHPVLGCAFVPPSPFLLKDFERYDVSRFVDPGCVSPEEGLRTLPADPSEVRFGTIAGALADLAGKEDLSAAVLLLHAPPHGTDLDRAALDGRLVDGVPLDVHVGSIAVRRFIEARQPLVSLHGHVHESPRLTGAWRQEIGRTHAFSGAHDGPELALVRFDLDDPRTATRQLVG